MALDPDGYNLYQNPPQLADLLFAFKASLKQEFNCHAVGRIEKFYPETQTADVSISYSKIVLQIDGQTKAITPTSVPNATLFSAPVIVLGGGRGYLTFPIGLHDECLILFNDRDIDNWFAGSYNSPPATNRLHSSADAIVLVGVRNLDCLISSYSTNSVDLRYHGTHIQLYIDKVVITLSTGLTFTLNQTGKVSIENGSGELLTQIIKLLQDIQTGTVNTIFGPQLLVMPTFAADLAVLETFKA